MKLNRFPCKFVPGVIGDSQGEEQSLSQPQSGTEAWSEPRRVVELDDESLVGDDDIRLDVTDWIVLIYLSIYYSLSLSLDKHAP